jgi:hypothetical protein
MIRWVLIGRSLQADRPSKIFQAGLVADQIGLLVAAGNQAVFQDFDAWPIRRNSPRPAGLAPAKREGRAEVPQPTLE